ncbi:hypothetical protein Hanom_Chr15g01363671 [Helianthus anomalus]
MMFQALGCCTLLYMFSKQLLIVQPPLPFSREKGRHAIVNPSSTLPPLRRRGGVTVIVNVSTPTVATARKGFEGLDLI